MTGLCQIDGLGNVLANLSTQVALIKGKTKHGLEMAAMKVKTDAQAMTPVDTGNLKGGARAEAMDTPRGPVAIVRYEAEYAVFVHELHPSESGRGRKYLERSVAMNVDEIVRIIRERAKL